MEGSEEHQQFHAAIAEAAYDPKNADLSHLGLSKTHTLSNRNRQTFVDDKTKTVFISHRGTNPKNFLDLTHDAAIAAGVHHLTTRFKNADKHLNKVKQMYPEHNVVSVGHSLGGTIALHQNQKHKVDSVVYNPGLGLGHAAKSIYDKATEKLLGNKPLDHNATVYHTGGDFISGISKILSKAKVFIQHTKAKNKHSLLNFFKR